MAREREAAWAADVFISYARQDAEVALRLYNGLMKRGFRVWIDQISLIAGQDWKREIHRAIRNSRVFIAVLSNRSVSKRGYVQKELKLGLEVLDEMPPSQIYMIPVRAEPCEPEHERINDLHWVDLFPDFEAGIERVVAALRTVEPA